MINDDGNVNFSLTPKNLWTILFPSFPGPVFTLKTFYTLHIGFSPCTSCSRDSLPLVVGAPIPIMALAPILDVIIWLSQVTVSAFYSSWVAPGLTHLVLAQEINIKTKMERIN